MLHCVAFSGKKEFQSIWNISQSNALPSCDNHSQWTLGLHFIAGKNLPFNKQLQQFFLYIEKRNKTFLTIPLPPPQPAEFWWDVTEDVQFQRNCPFICFGGDRGKPGEKLGRKLPLSHTHTLFWLLKGQYEGIVVADLKGPGNRGLRITLGYAGQVGLLPLLHLCTRTRID